MLLNSGYFDMVGLVPIFKKQMNLNRLLSCDRMELSTRPRWRGFATRKIRHLKEREKKFSV
jgi:hypothetical protein